MIKLHRNYNLQVQSNVTNSGLEEMIGIEPPFTIEFDISRTFLTSGSKATIKVLNLSSDTRNRILKDEFDYGNLKKIIFNAGYGITSGLPLVFYGEVSRAFSHRPKTEFVTQIEAFGGGYAYANAKYNEQFPSQTEQRTVIESMFKSLKPFNVTPGAIGTITGKLSKGNSYQGNCIDLLNGLAPGSVFIDNGKINVLANDEVIAGDVLEINSGSGLLGTPTREQTYLIFDMMFEPSVKIGQQVKVQSKTAQNFNGFYKVCSVSHKGTISESVCGSATTQIGVFYGTKSLRPVEQQT